MYHAKQTDAAGAGDKLFTSSKALEGTIVERFLQQISGLGVKVRCVYQWTSVLLAHQTLTSTRCACVCMARAFIADGDIYSFRSTIAKYFDLDTVELWTCCNHSIKRLCS